VKLISMRIPEDLYKNLYLLSLKENKTVTATILSLIDEKLLITEKTQEQLSKIERTVGLALNYTFEIKQQKISEKLNELDKKIDSLTSEIANIKKIDNLLRRGCSYAT